MNVLIRIKKFFFPTKYDIEQRDLYHKRVDFYSQFIKSGNLCFDIGANLGNRTSVFIELGAKVIALEPQKKCFDYLSKRFSRKAIILQKGVGAQIGEMDFYISDVHHEVSSFSKDWLNDLKERFEDIKYDRIESVQVVTLDSLIEEFGSPAFIKIDVEGFELEVLKGLTRKVKCLCFEYAVPEKLNNLFACLNLLNENFENLSCNYIIGENTGFASYYCPR